jgi:hypothetical protein
MTEPHVDTNLDAMTDEAGLPTEASLDVTGAAPTVNLPDAAEIAPSDSYNAGPAVAAQRSAPPGVQVTARRDRGVAINRALRAWNLPPLTTGGPEEEDIEQMGRGKAAALIAFYGLAYGSGFALLAWMTWTGRF